MLMTTCEIHEFPCVGIDYSRFDGPCALELREPITADAIINRSSFCTPVPISSDLRLEELQASDYLKGLSGKMGLYHLWIDYDRCDDHDKYTMKCVYVGKGFAAARVESHIKEKFPETDLLYVTFFECRNRIAKYLEQLFLDSYTFELNKSENGGSGTLYGVWDDFRYLSGTQLHEVANILGKRIGPGPYQV